MKKHVNVGTIGHIDYGLNRTTTAMTLGTGDYIDPTPWTEEDHDRFIKAIEKVRNHPHTKILASMGVEYVNGFKVNK
jgi:translation elongation factor EF-Tu-like GTPase